MNIRRVLLSIAVLGWSLPVMATDGPMVNESARNIPVAYQVDVVVVGGSTGAVSAAVAAAEHGAKVFLAAPRPYLGDDMTATLRLWLEKDEIPVSPLAKALFGDYGGKAAAISLPRPMHIKKTLDEALLRAHVDFLYNCYATDVLRDASGNPCGIVMANRAGRQAVVAKTIIDATDRAVIVRLAGARFRPFPSGTQTFRRVVIGGSVQSGTAISARTIGLPFVGSFPNAAETKQGVLYVVFPEKAKTKEGRFSIIEYTMELPMADDSDAAWAKADQEARGKTYDPNQQFASDVLFQVPPDAMLGRQTADGAWQGVEKLPLEAFQPKNVNRVWVLGGCADVVRPQAEKLLRPLSLIDLGLRLGTEAAAEAKNLPAPVGTRLKGKPCDSPAAQGDVGEQLVGVRPTQQLPKIPADARALPVLGRYDVVVIGGGTAGAPAGIGAARQGAKTLVIERLCGLGGVGTAGAITTYQGNCYGFTAEVEGGRRGWVIEQKMEWWRSALRKAGADIWFGCTGCGAYVDAGRVRGAVVVTPRGRGVVLADVVVDATGNADVAAAAGAACAYVDSSEFAMQGTGMPPRYIGAAAANTDYTYSYDADMVDAWHLMVYAKEKFKNAFDLGQLVDTRERRHIVGDFTLTILDQVSERTFPDTIAKAEQTGYDSHAYVVDPFLLIRHPLNYSFHNYVPYRCLLPKGVDGLLVTGIGLSAQRDAQAMVRMQPEIQNQGYAAGVAAAMVAKAKTSVRQIDIRALQRHLVQIGNLPKSVLTDQDSFPLSSEKIAEAVAHVADDYRSAAIVFAHREQSLPLLRKAYIDADGEKKLICAKVLGVLGDAAGLETLLKELDSVSQWDKVPAYCMGRKEPGSNQVGWHMSNLDTTLVAIGRTRSVKALPAVLKKLDMLRSDKKLPLFGGGAGDPKKASHYLAVFMALEWIGDPRAAEPLAALLRQPGMGGYAVTSIEQRAQSERNRMPAEYELTLARTLYHCGDWEGLGEKTLRAYSQDLRGPFAMHAQAVLTATKSLDERQR